MPTGQISFIPTGGAYGYAATTDPVADQTTHEESPSATLTADLALKAPLASPAFTGSATMAGDLTFDVATHGPVIVDTANGHTYRLESTNGSLVLTQVS